MPTTKIKTVVFTVFLAVIIAVVPLVSSAAPVVVVRPYHTKGIATAPLYYFSATNNTTTPTTSTAHPTGVDVDIVYDLTWSGSGNQWCDGFIEITVPFYWIDNTNPSAPQVWSTFGSPSEYTLNNWLFVSYDGGYSHVEDVDVASTSYAFVTYTYNSNVATNISQSGDSNEYHIRIDYVYFREGHDSAVGWLCSLAHRGLRVWDNLAVRRRDPNDGFLSTRNWNNMTPYEQFYILYGYYPNLSYDSVVALVDNYGQMKAFSSATLPSNILSGQFTQSIALMSILWNHNSVLTTLILSIFSVTSVVVLFNVIRRWVL